MAGAGDAQGPFTSPCVWYHPTLPEPLFVRVVSLFFVLDAALSTYVLPKTSSFRG